MINVISSGREMEVFWFCLPKIIIATICGAIIGYDREKKNKGAGLRTNILICVGSAFFTIISIILADQTHTDPSRMLSTIVTGIGFLGGGVIMKNDDKITGMTTASFIWVISSIGIFCGLGLIGVPMILTIGLLIISKIFEKVERIIHKEKDASPRD